jgi:hypothetical protein
MATMHPMDAMAQWGIERAALVRCARALAFTYGGAPPPAGGEPEEQALWEAMHAAYRALGVTDTRDLPAPDGDRALARA